MPRSYPKRAEQASTGTSDRQEAHSEGGFRKCILPDLG